MRLHDIIDTYNVKVIYDKMALAVAMVAQRSPQPLAETVP